MQVIDSETITVSNTAIGLTTAKLDTQVDHVTVYVEEQIRVWTSGKTPTASQGVPLYRDTERSFTRNEALSLKMIRVGTVDVPVQVQYYRV